MTLLSKHEKRDPRRLPKSANLSESLILSLFLYFFTCSVTVDIPSYDELKSAVKEIAEDFEWVCSKDGQIIMKIEDWIENARLRLGKEYPDVLIYIGRSFVNPKELIIGGVVNDDDEQKLFENYFNNQNPPVPIHFKIIVQNEE